MAQLEMEGKVAEVADGESIIEACRDELDIPFGCESGVCGSCYINVKKGGENLSEPTEQETDMGFEPPQRLACQCTIKSGHVEFER